MMMLYAHTHTHMHRRFPTRVQHPTLLSQSLSGPLEAAAPYLHDAPLLPDAQDLGFADLIMPRPRSAAASRPASPGDMAKTLHILQFQGTTRMQRHCQTRRVGWPHTRLSFLCLSSTCCCRRRTPAAAAVAAHVSTDAALSDDAAVEGAAAARASSAPITPPQQVAAAAASVPPQ